jgi:Uncharacterized conserved protein (DUF2303)
MRQDDEQRGDTFRDLIKEAAEGEETIFDIIKETVPFTDEDGNEKEMPGRRITITRRGIQHEQVKEAELARSPRRAHNFNHAAGLLQYLETYGGEATVVLADVEGMAIYAVLDDKAERGKETITYKPRLHPRFLPWNEICGQTLPIDEFVNFLRENRRAITEPNGRGLLLSLSQIRASTSVELHAGQGNDSLNGLTVRTKIAGKDGSDLIELPESIKIRVPLLIEDEEPRDIELDLILSASRDGTGVTGKFATTDVEAARADAFMEQVESLQALEKKHKGSVVTFGSPGDDVWAVLEYDD